MGGLWAGDRLHVLSVVLLHPLPDRAETNAARERLLCSSSEVGCISTDMLWAGMSLVGSGAVERDVVVPWGQVQFLISLTAPGHLQPPLLSKRDKMDGAGFVWDSSNAQLFLQGRMS